MYDYTGRVNVLSTFAQESYLVRPDVRVTGSLQWRGTRYAIGKDRYQGYDFSLRYSSLNPRVGANWNLTDRWNLFASFAHMQAEPILSEIYTADDPTSVPLFRRVDVARSIYEDPLVHPERLSDYEAGAGYRSARARVKLTGFWLDFRDEIVPSGAIDAFGVPINGNAARSSHRGIELEGAVQHRSGLELSGNLSVSRNRFDSFREYAQVVSFPAATTGVIARDYSGNAIALFPDRMANLTLGYRRGGVRCGLTLVETGKQYLDNTEDNRLAPFLRSFPGYQRKLIPEHAVLNADLALDLTALARQSLLGEEHLALDVRVMNATDLRYETSGYVDSETPYFYPAARRNAFVSLRAEF
jgi:iron complex outermembrane receptor protein